MKAVSISTERFKSTNGGRKPKGFGDWIFKIGRSEFSYVAEYSEAAKKAKEAAAFQNIPSITLLP